MARARRSHQAAQASARDRARRQVHRAARRLHVGHGSASPRRLGAGAHDRHPLGRLGGAHARELRRAAWPASPACSCPGGFGHRGIEGKVLAARYARENSVPYLGLCLGLQCGVIEFARDVVGAEDANSTEFDLFTNAPVIDFMPDQRDDGGQGRHDAPRPLPGAPAARLEGARGVRRRGHLRAPSPSLRGQQRVPRRARAAAAWSSRASRPTAAWSRSSSSGTTPGSWRRSSIPSSSSRPDRPHPLFVGFREGGDRATPTASSSDSRATTRAASATRHPGRRSALVRSVTATLDPFVLEHAPGPLASLAPVDPRGSRGGQRRARWTRSRRSRQRRSARSWNWDGNDADVRYGFYRLLEVLERAAAAAARAVAAKAVDRGTRRRCGRGRGAVGAARDPRHARRGGPRRRSRRWRVDGSPNACAHDQLAARLCVGLARGGSPSATSRASPGRSACRSDIFDAAPEEEREADGSLADVRAHLDDLVDSTSARYATLTTDELAVMGGWSGVAVDLALPPVALVVAHPGAHRPGREDARPARPAAVGGRAAGSTDRTRVRAARGGRLLPRRRRA